MTSLGVLLVILQGYRSFNILRILRGRMHANYLWHVTYRTSLWLIGLQLASIALWYCWSLISLPRTSILGVLLLLQLLLSVVMYRTVGGHARRMYSAAELAAVNNESLPSLTVCIPARNETTDLEECLRSVVACHYPKLEILVLDDCSQTTRTPEIIRSFAHDGVRFIQGDAPSETWLAKNQAYASLAKAASGSYLLYIGVDIRLEPTALRRMMSYALSKQKSMLSVMPLNRPDHGGQMVIQPMRYLWELALPRRTFDHPPVLSSCWLISREALRNAGGFKAAARKVVPEAFFARQLLSTDGYSFLASGTTMGVSSVKSSLEQKATAVRVSYPQTHRRPEVVAALTGWYAAWLILPAIAVIYNVVTQADYVLLVIAMTLIGVSLMVYARVLRLAYNSVPLRALLALPVALGVQAALLNYSMYKYEFSEVIWKDRNVCVPAMHVIPRLPKF